MTLLWLLLPLAAADPTPPKPMVSRCTHTEVPVVRLAVGDAVKFEGPGAELLKREGSFALTKGRHVGETGLPLAALLAVDATATGVALVPCKGEPLPFAAEVLRADPQKLVLVLNKHKHLKLLDYSVDDPRQAMLHTLYEVRLEAGTPAKK